MKFLKKAIPLVLAVCLVFGLTACGSKRPKDAKELLALSKQNENVDNYKFDANFDLKLDVQLGTNNNLSLPIEAKFDGKVFDNKAAHMNMNIDLKMGEMSQSMKLESYIDGDTIYQMDENGKWSKDKADTSEKNIIDISKVTDESLFEKAEMTYDKSKKEYIVKMNAGEVFKDVNPLEMVGMGDITKGMSDEDSKELFDAFGKSEIVYVFDDNYYLKSYSIKDMDYSFKGEEDSVEQSVHMNMNLEINVHDYGKVKEDEVKPSEEIIKAATEKTSDEVEHTEKDLLP